MLERTDARGATVAESDPACRTVTERASELDVPGRLAGAMRGPVVGPE
ncbi:MAG TPA: hypothetical protein VF103_01300 [Polyangiaceae bacterium]